MATPHIPYQKPDSLLDLKMITLEQLRTELSQRIHNLDNRRSTGAFMDSALCYFEPGLIYEVAIKLQPSLDWGSATEFTRGRRQVIESVVTKLREAGAVEEQLLRSIDHYCGKFRVCLGRGCADPLYLDVWLVPVRPSFFWAEMHPNVSKAAEVVKRRQLTGLAALHWVAPLNQKGRTV